MPAIRYLNGSKPQIVNQYRDSLLSRVHAYTSGSALVIPQWYGFICNAGASYLKGGKIVRLVVEAIASGDGTDEADWIALPEGHFALGWWIPPSAQAHDSGELYGLVDDYGWPMTTLRYRDLTHTKIPTSKIECR